MNLDVAMVSTAGGKPVNEDSVWFSVRGTRLAAAVADGLGAHGDGDIASQAAIRAIENAFKNAHRPLVDVLPDCLAAANKAVLAHQTAGRSMKSTAIVLAIEPSQAFFAHVGDSRGYGFCNCSITYQTMDHSVSQLAVLRNMITPQQIRFHEGRSRLLRALGMDETAEAEITPLKPPEEGDAYLLCSDGFWEYVTEDEMEIDLAKSASAESWLSYMLARIGANVAASHDNLSAIAVLCKG